MMHTHCPLCGHEFPPDRVAESLEICVCGWTPKTMAKKADKQTAQLVLRATIGLVLFLLPTVLYLSSWNGLGMEITTLRLLSSFGIASQQQQLDLADYMVRLQKYDKAESILRSLSKRYAKERIVHERLIKLETKMQNKEQLVEAYAAYFKNATNPDLNWRYRYALALADCNRVQEAITEFESILASQPNQLQITVTHHYVQMLVDRDMLGEAQDVIRRFQVRGSNAEGYLNDERELVESKIAGKPARDS